MKGVLLGTLLAVSAFVVMSCGGDSACSDAQSNDMAAIDNVCKHSGVDGGSGVYGSSLFCNLCVSKGYYSMTSAGGGVCSCARLTYAAPSCAFTLSENDRIAAARSAVDYADMTCSSFTPPGGIDDGGADADSEGAPEAAPEASTDAKMQIAPDAPTD